MRGMRPCLQAVGKTGLSSNQQGSACLCRFGLVYPGVGWVIYRDKAALPDEMVLMTSYLGKPEPTVSINFSRNAAQVAASYYNVCPDPLPAPVRVYHQATAYVAHALLWRACRVCPALSIHAEQYSAFSAVPQQAVCL